jgi:hypothetical protein
VLPILGLILVEVTFYYLVTFKKTLGYLIQIDYDSGTQGAAYAKSPVAVLSRQISSITGVQHLISD